MFDAEASSGKPTKSKSAILCLAGGLAAVIAASGMIMLASPKPASATPAIAAKTGYACGRCHTSPSGGGALTRFGHSWARHHK